MKNFKIGDRVKCINNQNVEQNLILNKTYIVFNIDFKYKTIQLKDNTWWDASRFKKVSIIPYTKIIKRTFNVKI